jgi:hypothetical protein
LSRAACGGSRSGEQPGTQQAVVRIGAAEEHSLDQTNVGRTRALRRLLYGELDPLSLPQELECSARDTTPMKEVFNPAIVAYESEALIDEEPGNRSRRALM